MVSLFGWGLCGWASLAPQQHILVTAKPDDGATAVVANASANYLGAAIGSAAASALIAHHTSPTYLAAAAALTAILVTALQLIRARITTH